MRFGVIWDFLWILTASSQTLMIHLLSGMPPMRLLLPLLMLHFHVLVVSPVLLVAILLPPAVLLQVAKRSLMRKRRPKKMSP